MVPIMMPMFVMVHLEGADDGSGDHHDDHGRHGLQTALFPQCRLATRDLFKPEIEGAVRRNVVEYPHLMRIFMNGL
jgi:hypothetical protein